MDSSQQHKQTAAEVHEKIAIAIVTVSDSRTAQSDMNAAYFNAQFEQMGHILAGYRIVKDEPDEVVAALDEMIDKKAQIILFNGGTGISKRDRTYDALSGRLEKVLSGFGELFRMLSWDQVGSAAMLSRATAGVYRNAVVVSTPGSPKAVQLAWEKLIAPELHHLAWELTR